MAITYVKKENDDVVTFTYKNNLLYSGIMLVFLIYGVSEQPFANISISIAVLMVFLRTFERFKSSREIRRLTQDATVSVSGSHFSFQDPYTLTFTKNK